MYFKVNTINGQWYWLLCKNNGDSVAQAPNIYGSLADAQKDINLIKQWASTSEVRLPTMTPPVPQQ
jgi:uncharacterized protein YegP (UPF0339 family)